MTRTIVGVLFAEPLWARMSAAARRERGEIAPPPLDPRYMPGDDVVDRLAALATLLRALADEGDLLWTPRAFDPVRMPDVPGVARPLLLTGARPTPGPGDLTWADLTPAAAAANDRRVAAEVQRALGCALPGTSVVTSEEAIEEAVADAAGATAAGTWIAKAVHSSAGRGRVGGRGSPADARHRAGVENLLELHGAVIVEPWVPRLADFGATAAVTDESPTSGAKDFDVHTLENTVRGDFRGIAIPAAGLRDEERTALAVAARSAARALASRGYRGPFGIDAFRWRDRTGAERFQPICEINARCTFGRIARAFAARVAAATGRDAAGPWRFRVGTAEEMEAARAAAGAAPFHPLLTPGPPDDIAAWISG